MMAAFAGWRGWPAISRVLALLIAFYFAYFAVTRPALDWDVVPYTMAILKTGATSPAGMVDVVLLHQQTWAAIKPFLTPGELAYLTAANEYVQAQYADPAALFSQLPLYECKYGYVMVLRAVALAMDPVRAIVMVSLVSTLGILAILVHAAGRLDGIAALGWLPIALLFDLSSYASMLSPDPVSTFAYVAGLAALLSQRSRLAVFCFLMATLLRPDAIVLNLLLCGVFAFRRDFGATFVLLLGSFVAFFINVSASQHVGWWAQFHFNFVERRKVLTAVSPLFDLGLYFEVLAHQIRQVAHLDWLHAAVTAVLIAILLLARSAGGRWAGLLLAALLVGAAVRFVLYPSSELRFYTPHLFGIGLIILHALKPRGAAG